jgi:SAM-dependent methyltransferase
MKSIIKSFTHQEYFEFYGKRYNYFNHKYNTTGNNERAVEIPIIWDIVEWYYGKKVLEIGNVLSHYFPINHIILDKYETADNVISQDVVDFHPNDKYDLIISISTLEHVGWDEPQHEPNKIIKAVDNLNTILEPKGKLVVTLPLGYNSDMDRLLKEGKLKFDKQFYMKRVSEDNKWIEVGLEHVADIKYSEPFPCANGLVIGINEASEKSKLRRLFRKVGWR